MRSLQVSRAPLLLPLLTTAALCLGGAVAGCTETVVSATPAPTDDAGAGSGDAATGPTGPWELGDGTATSVTFTLIHEVGASEPTDLGFHPERTGEVWVLGQADDSAHVGQNVDTDEPVWQKYLDPARRHFMHRPTSIAMGDKNDWGTCGDNDNSQNTADQIPNYFMGPALFSADLSIFAKRTPGGLGSHLDMLHSSPFCRGITHVGDRVYWVFNAHDKSLDRYHFNEDHGPGNDDHSDGEIYRFAEGEIEGAADGTPSHLFYDPSDEMLYVADTGHQRIIRLDTTQGTRTTRSLPRRNEPLVDECYYDDAVTEEVVPAGSLSKPSGLEVKGDIIYVTDTETSEFVAFDKSGTELRRLATDLPAGSLAGFAFGPDGKIWFVDRLGGQILRIDPR